LGSIDVDEVTGPATPPIVARPLDEQERRIIRDQIGGLDPAQQDWARNEWKARGLPPLKPIAGKADLTDQHLGAVMALLADADRQPADAEIVPETPSAAARPSYAGPTADTADPTLPPCEADTDDGVIVGVSPPDPADRVPDRGGPVTMADPIDDSAARRYAREAREAIDRAKETLGASLDATVICDICHKPINEKNDGCASKAHAF